jgi:uncharacterized protein with von Willebrand factor type A (vWA) domain
VLKTLAGLVAELRAVGIPVSPTEHIDAAVALRFTPLLEREAVKAALCATLVKNAEHTAAFSTAFDLYFADRRREPTSLSEMDDRLAAARVGGGGVGSGGLTELDDGELRELLYRALRDGDEPLLRALAGVIVDRHAGIEPGRRVAGTYYLFRALRAVDLESLLGRLREEFDADQSLVDGRLAGVEAAARVDSFRAEVEFEIRARMVADRGPEDVARTLRRPLPEDVEFLNATRADTVAIREALRPLARKLAARLARKRRSDRSAPLDFRHTMRRALSTGGVPVELAFRKPHPSRPQLIVIADISGSVATFAAFTLQLVYALRSEFARVRTFVFVDGIEEVTQLMESADDLVEVTRALNRGTSAVWLSGRSDYGNALRTFVRRYGDQVQSRSTVLVLGDARNNYLPAREESLHEVATRAKALYWLNPERRQMWNEGDSIIGRYAGHCSGVYECRTVRQLRTFVEQLSP